MDKLNPEYLPLLFDEPIFVLNDHLTREDMAQDENEAPAALPSCKGENKKGILIVNEDNSHAPISPEDEEFLFKGLNTLNITLADVAIISAGDEQKAGVAFNKKIVFRQNPPADQLYEVNPINTARQLTCQTIAEIRKSKDLKVKFWLGLKKLFPVEE